MLQAENIGVKHKGATLLSHITLSVKAGEWLALLGKNGAGKSTLMKVLAGVLPSTLGMVTIAEQPLAEYERSALAKRFVYLSQHRAAHWDCNVFDLVSLGAYPFEKQLSKQHLRQKAREALAVFDLESMARLGYQQLSGGERQRAHLARICLQCECAMLNNKVLLLLDEPFAHLDSHYQQKLCDILQAWRGRGCAIVTVMHDWEMAKNYSDRYLILKAGQNFQTGESKSLLTE